MHTGSVGLTLLLLLLLLLLYIYIHTHTHSSVSITAHAFTPFHSCYKSCPSHPPWISGCNVYPVNTNYEARRYVMLMSRLSVSLITKLLPLSGTRGSADR
jgi:hypothetical protein